MLDISRRNHSNMSAIHLIFMTYLLIFMTYILTYNLPLDYLHNQFFIIAMESQIRVVVCS